MIAYVKNNVNMMALNNLPFEREINMFSVDLSLHYNEVLMRVMASQISSP